MWSQSTHAAAICPSDRFAGKWSEILYPLQILEHLCSELLVHEPWAVAVLGKIVNCEGQVNHVMVMINNRALTPSGYEVMRTSINQASLRGLSNLEGRLAPDETGMFLGFQTPKRLPMIFT